MSSSDARMELGQQRKLSFSSRVTFHVQEEDSPHVDKVDAEMFDEQQKKPSLIGTVTLTRFRCRLPFSNVLIISIKLRAIHVSYVASNGEFSIT